MDGENNLVGIAGDQKYRKTAEGAGVQTEDGIVPVALDSKVSMNMWGLQPEFLDELESGFVKFLSGLSTEDSKTGISSADDH